MSEARVMVCACADVKFVAPGTTFGNRCRDCGKILALAPSGQRFMQKYPDTQVICAGCFATKTDVDGVNLPAPLKDIAAELAARVPNTWEGPEI